MHAQKQRSIGVCAKGKIAVICVVSSGLLVAVLLSKSKSMQLPATRLPTAVPALKKIGMVGHHEGSASASSSVNLSMQNPLEEAAVGVCTGRNGNIHIEI